MLAQTSRRSSSTANDIANYSNHTGTTKPFENSMSAQGERHQTDVSDVTHPGTLLPEVFMFMSDGNTPTTGTPEEKGNISSCTSTQGSTREVHSNTGIWHDIDADSTATASPLARQETTKSSQGCDNTDITRAPGMGTSLTTKHPRRRAAKSATTTQRAALFKKPRMGVKSDSRRARDP